ncbi:MAG TPA: type II secretion system protein [Vicinamibacterales bacterium]|nr:type II secretion system protein [Vicinamibacterales bacterium]
MTLVRGAAAEHGFTIIELLVAMTIVMAVSAVLAGASGPARDAFERIPAELDLQQRARTAVGVIADAVRASGRVAPRVEPDQLTVIVPVIDAAQGLLLTGQISGGDPLMLSAVSCPNVRDVCGFTPGTTAVIINDVEQYDIFEVAATSIEQRRLSADRVLSRAYVAGSELTEVVQYSFYLMQQNDGSTSLVRETAAGAIQPIVDFVSDLMFAMAGDRHVEMSIRVHPTARLQRPIASRVFRSTMSMRNVP